MAWSRADRVDAEGDGHVTQAGYILVERQHLVVIGLRVAGQIPGFGRQLRRQFIRASDQAGVPFGKGSPIGKSGHQERWSPLRRGKGFRDQGGQVLKAPTVPAAVQRLLQGRVRRRELLESKVKGGTLRYDDFDG